MRGYHVARKAGWDCHGLPVELAVEKELGFSGKKDIEAYGIAEFNARCRESVTRHTDAFAELTTRMGYWVDLDDAYRTMDPEYIESVWWSLKEIFGKGLLVQDHRVAPWCPRCGTGLSDHELAQGYETVVDPSVYVRFPLTSGPLAGEASLVVWTTTPWTLVSNTAVAAHPDVTYVVATDGREKLVVARPLLEKALGEGWEATDLAFTGAEMERWTYRRPFDLVEFPEAAHFVVTADYVTTEDGTGLVHQAPAFGEDDLRVCRAYGLPVVNPVRPDGTFEEDLPLVGGAFFKKADEALTADLEARGLLFRHIAYEHSYPHCWRCHTALLYYAQPSWYIRTTAVKDRLLEENEATNWFPDSVKHGRFGDWLNNNIDWALSRNRYWGTPLPIWRCEEGHLTCVGSRGADGADRRRPVGPGPAPPLHRRRHVRLHPRGLPAHRDPRAGGHRRLVRLGVDAVRAVGLPVPEQGAVREALPGAVHLGGHRPDPRLVLHADGRRHARLRQVVVRERRVPRPHPRRGRPQDVQAPGEHPPADPADGPARRGRGALVHGGRRLPWAARRVGHGTIQEVVRKTLLTYWNTVAFQALYARTAGWAPSAADPAPAERTVLDRWLLSELHALTDQVTQALEAYDTQRAGKLLSAFVDDLSNWYVRRSRRRFWQGDKGALRTLHEAVETVTRLMAPLTPFITERVWQDLVVPVTPGAPESVHLSTWPEADPSAIDPELSRQMALVRRLVELGRATRGVRCEDPAAAVAGAGGRGRFRGALPELHAQITEELNVSSLASLSEVGGSLVDTTAKANFRALGKRFGKGVQDVARAVAGTDAAALSLALRTGEATLDVNGETITLTPEEVIITETPREGWSVASDAGATVALDLEITPELRLAGLARDAIRLIQEARKNSGLDVADRIALRWSSTDEEVVSALEEHAGLIAEEVLATDFARGEGDGTYGEPFTDEALSLVFRLRKA